MLEPDQDLVAVLEHVLVDARALAEGPVGRAQVVQDHALALDRDVAVFARDALVDHADVGGLAAADDGRVVRQLVHLAHGAAGQDDEVGLIPARLRLDRSRRVVFLNPRDVVPVDGHGS